MRREERFNEVISFRKGFASEKELGHLLLGFVWVLLEDRECSSEVSFVETVLNRIEV